MLRFLITFRNSTPQLILIINFWKQEMKIIFFKKPRRRPRGYKCLLLMPDSLGWDPWSPWRSHKVDDEESMGLPSDCQSHALAHKYEHISSNRAILSKSDSVYIFYRWSLTQVVHDTATLEKRVNKHRTRYMAMFCLDVSMPLQARNRSSLWPWKLNTGFQLHFLLVLKFK